MRRRNKNVAVRMTEDEYAALTMRGGAKVSGREEVKELQKLNGRFADTNRQLRGDGNQYQPDGACGKQLRTDTTAGTTGTVAPRVTGIPKGV